MSTLSSSSTYSDAVDAYLDNASYEEDASVTKAKAFVTACRFLIRFPARTQVGGRGAGHEMEFDLKTLREEITAAQDWIAVNDEPAAGRTTFGDFSDFRY